MILIVRRTWDDLLQFLTVSFAELVSLFHGPLTVPGPSHVSVVHLEHDDLRTNRLERTAGWRLRCSQQPPAKPEA